MNIIVNFASNERYKKIKSLTQYDYGQYLEIHGLSLPGEVWVYFSCKKSGGMAKRRLATTVNNVTTVKIPDDMLINDNRTVDYIIYACIFVFDDTSGRTEYGIQIPVKSVSKRDDEDVTDEENAVLSAFIASTINRIEALEQKEVDLTGYATEDFVTEAVGVISVPTMLSDLSGDAMHRTVTDEQIAAWNAKLSSSGIYVGDTEPTDESVQIWIDTSE